MSLSSYDGRFARSLGLGLLAVTVASAGVVTTHQPAASTPPSSTVVAPAAAVTPSRDLQLVFPKGRFYVRLTPGSGRRPARILPVRKMSAVYIAAAGHRIFWLNRAPVPRRDPRTFHYSLRRVSTTGRHPVTLVRRGMTFAFSLAATRDHVFWINSQAGTIGRVSVDGSRIQRRWLLGIPRQSSGDIADGLATDGRFLYVGQCFRGRIGRVPLDARRRERQVEWIVRGINTCPQDLEVSGGFIYWSGFTRSGAGPGVIGRAPAAGGAPTQVWTEAHTFGGPLSLAVVNGFLYWDWGTSGPRAKDFLGRVNVDGTRFTRQLRRIGPYPITAVTR